MIVATRYHDISCGHTVFNHESKCAMLHGHNYRVTFHISAKELDAIGRVMDFSVIKEKLCMWLEDNWDHRFLVWEEDDRLSALAMIDREVVATTFNPTAENMAKHLVEVVGPAQLEGTWCRLVKCEVEETRKCSASYEL